jgi:hypothetical protein
MMPDNTYVKRGVFIGSLNESQLIRRALAVRRHAGTGALQPLHERLIP